MTAFPGVEKFLNWLLNHSLQASVLVLLVLLVQWAFRRQLTNRWRFALWWVVVIRLLLPFGPESAWSLFNYFQPHVALERSRSYSRPPHESIAVIAPEIRSSIPQKDVPPIQAKSGQFGFARDPLARGVAEPAAGERRVVTPAPAQPVPRASSRSANDLLLPGIAAAWLAGVVALALFVCAQCFRFQRKLNRSAAPGDSTTRELLEMCRSQLGVRRRVTLAETDAIKSPALFGVFRLRLLLPAGLAARFTRDELRYIFLHELAHVKRGDLWLNWLVTALQVMHWFNPLIWLGFARLRADRELACDELVLLHAGERTGETYGGTIIKLLEGLSRPAAIPGLIGILEDKHQMRRRIAMIVNFRKPGRWSALAVLLLGLLAAATWTDAQSETDPAHPNATAEPITATSFSLAARLADLGLKEDAGIGVRPDLVGQVMAKGGGPLTGTVFIATAAPKTGSSTLCPSCYADCAKRGNIGADGNFKIESLSPQLTFQVLAVAKGYKPKSIAKVDPAAGAMKIELEPIESADAAPDRSLRGQVVDSANRPIEGAVVEMQGIQSRDGGGSWGALRGIDPLAVTDERGQFLITAKEPFDMMSVRVEARACANRHVQ